MRQEGELVVVATVYSRIEFAVLLSLLEQEGIWAAARGAYHVGLDPALTVALGGIDLQVSRHDADRASQLLTPIARCFPHRGIYSDFRPLDVVLALLLCWFGLPPPARIPAFTYAIGAPDSWAD